jgi:hypothetical protein
LQRTLDLVKGRGLGLAVVSYDSVAVLRGFAEKHDITFPLLSDEGSRTITAWGLRNPEATGRATGVPYPGTFVIDPAGVIRARSFEDAYQERQTAASILAGLGQPSRESQGGPEVLGSHVRAVPGLSDGTAAPGQRITLFVDVIPGARIHVYAPGQEDYLPVELKLTDSVDFRLGPAAYPESRPYVFEPLNETVQVFDGPFRIRRDITLALTPAMRERAQEGATLSIAGILDYQACDDKVCFNPESLPLTWRIRLSPFVR